MACGDGLVTLVRSSTGATGLITKISELVVASFALSCTVDSSFVDEEGTSSLAFCVSVEGMTPEISLDCEFAPVSAGDDVGALFCITGLLFGCVFAPLSSIVDVDALFCIAG